MKIQIVFIIHLILLAISNHLSAQITIHNREYNIITNPEYMTINMGGLLDGENTYTESLTLKGEVIFEPMISASISNIGSELINSPRLIINNRRRWQNFSSLSTEILTGMETNKDKALSIWKILRDNRFHFRTPTLGTVVYDPIGLLGIYGYLTCGSISKTITSIGSELGYPGKIWHLRYQPQPERAHAIAEIDFGDGFVILDVDAHVFMLDYDNQSLIGYNEAVEDNFLVDRTHFFGKAQTIDLDMGVMFNKYNSYNNASNNIGHTLDITLRPGESIIYKWKNATLFHHTSFPVPNPIPWHIANSRFVFRPLFEIASLNSLLHSYENITTNTNPVTYPVIHAQNLNTNSYFNIEIESPFVILDGYLKIYGYKATNRDSILIQISSDGNTWTNVWDSSIVGNFSDSVNFSNSLNLKVLSTQNLKLKDLDKYLSPLNSDSLSEIDSLNFLDDSKFPGLIGKYKYYLRFSFSPKDSIKACGFDSIQIATIVQTSRRFMPQLRIGENLLEYTDANINRNANIKIEWQESTENNPPSAIITPVFPLDSSQTNHNQFTFLWNAPLDPDGDKLIDYEFQLSDRQDMRFPLSTNFEMYLSAFGDSVVPEFTIPWPGLLNSGETYYWKVRAKDENGAWGKWSPVWSFLTNAVMMPVNGKVVKINNEYFLQWQKNPNGKIPMNFEIHGSNEPNGFIADSVTVIGQSFDPDFDLTGNIFDYYRIVAIDSQNLCSGPSRLIYFDNVSQNINDSDFEFSKIFKLFQNYPNPFNPETVISYQLSTASNVQLKIYNLIGQEVNLLVNKLQSQGRYKYTWNGLNAAGNKVASGIYVYQLRTDHNVFKKKMILLR